MRRSKLNVGLSLYNSVSIAKVVLLMHAWVRVSLGDSIWKGQHEVLIQRLFIMK